MMNEQNTEKYGLCVIGCGPGGFAGAMRGLDMGKNVCIVEGGEIGGTGVMWGALASKTMWELAKDYAVTSKVDSGYRVKDVHLDYQEVRDKVVDAVKIKQNQMLKQIDTFSPSLRQGKGSLTIKKGWGSFISENRISVKYPDGRTEEVESDYFLIATGSKPRGFEGIKIDQERILDSDGILNLKEFPKRLLIIGAGIIGCEYATIFSNFKQTKVYLVDHKENVIPYEDEDISNFVNVSLEKNGVTIFHSAVLKDIIKQSSHLDVILEFGDSHHETIEVDTVLISVGRVPNLSCLRLEKVGILQDTSGYIQTDNNCRVTKNIYAAGDVTHRPALVNMAEREGRHAVQDMFDSNLHKIKYSNMSTVMFFNPAVAAVGLNEKGCRKKNIPYRVAYYSYKLLSRAIMKRSLNGFVKIIVSDDEDKTILGMRAAGPHVSSMIMSIAFLIDHDIGIKDILKSVYPHPTISEGIQECIRLLLGSSIYKPEAFPDDLKIWTWRP